MYQKGDTLHSQLHIRSLRFRGSTPPWRKEDPTGPVPRKNRLGWPSLWSSQDEVGKVEKWAVHFGSVISSEMLQTIRFWTHQQCRVASLLWRQYPGVRPMLIPPFKGRWRPYPLLVGNGQSKSYTTQTSNGASFGAYSCCGFCKNK